MTMDNLSALHPPAAAFLRKGNHRRSFNSSPKGIYCRSSTSTPHQLLRLPSTLPDRVIFGKGQPLPKFAAATRPLIIEWQWHMAHALHPWPVTEGHIRRISAVDLPSPLPYRTVFGKGQPLPKFAAAFCALIIE